MKKKIEGLQDKLAGTSKKEQKEKEGGKVEKRSLKDKSKKSNNQTKGVPEIKKKKRENY